jgi:hypothetical protein
LRERRLVSHLFRPARKRPSAPRDCAPHQNLAADALSPTHFAVNAERKKPSESKATPTALIFILILHSTNNAAFLSSLWKTGPSAANH